MTVRVESETCLGFALRRVSGVRNGPSPEWMQKRLKAIGLRPINALVDITNYVTFDRGRPLHVFDAKKVAGDLVVRQAAEGEEILGLDGRTHTLNPKVCVIADDRGAESIAGIMGGEHSGCDEGTTDVLIESALWEPLAIARAGRALGIITDARYRFERGVDPAFMEPGLELATRLVMDLCGGTPSEVALTPARIEARGHPLPLLRSRAPDRPHRRARPPGRDPDAARVQVDERPDHALVVAPSWRPDIEGKADLVEEVMRLVGVDNIAPQPLPRLPASTAVCSPAAGRDRAARRTLAARGLAEAVTYSFVSAEAAKAFGGGEAHLSLENPIAADLSDMRPSLLPNLLQAAQRNAQRGYGDLALFEVASIYRSDEPDGSGAWPAACAGARQAMPAGRDWAGNAAAVGVFDAKADALAVLEAVGVPVERLQFETPASPWYHPGRSGRIKLGPKTVLAEFGEFHPRASRLWA